MCLGLQVPVNAKERANPGLLNIRFDVSLRCGLLIQLMAFFASATCIFQYYDCHYKQVLKNMVEAIMGLYK